MKPLKIPIFPRINFHASTFEFKFGKNFCKVTNNFGKIFFESLIFPCKFLICKKDPLQEQFTLY